MCLGGTNKYQKRALEAQNQALEQMTLAQKARTEQTVSKTNPVVKTNKDAQKRGIYSLRIPLKDKIQNSNGSANSYGLNIPL